MEKRNYRALLTQKQYLKLLTADLNDFIFLLKVPMEFNSIVCYDSPQRRSAETQAFWGQDVELIEGAELTWMRQPHYYMQLYSYTYSADLTIGTQMCRRIETEGEAAVADWKKALAAGGTLAPAEFAAVAGVDLTSEKPLMDTIAYIGEIIDEIVELTDELEQI